MNDFSGFKSEFIDENAPKHTKDSFKDLLENIHFFYKIAHPQSAVIHTQIPRFATNYNLYDNKQCDFSTPFKYLKEIANDISKLDKTLTENYSYFSTKCDLDKILKPKEIITKFVLKNKEKVYSQTK
mgnify:CR=1 FL=1